VHETAAALLRQIDQRYSGGRRAVVEVLARSDRPLTIHEILERDPEVPQSSAYRNLASLEQAGVVQRIVTNDEFARFELAEGIGEHHHHLICSVCGTVRDFTVSAQVEEDLGRTLTRAAKRSGFVIDHHRLDIIGTCSACR
jgi:Fe2+ or Zn2+ uptake regulation protein